MQPIKQIVISPKKRHSAATIIVIDDVTTCSTESIPIDHTSPIAIISFSTNEDLVHEVQQRLASSGIKINVISVAGHLDNLAPRVRDKYTHLIGSAPDTPIVAGKSLKQLLVLENRLSLWWLNEISAKRSDVYTTFNRLCQLEFIKDQISKNQASQILLFSHDSDFGEVMRNYVNSAGLDFIWSRSTGRPIRWGDSSVLRTLLVNVHWFTCTWIQSILAKIMLPSHRSSGQQANKRTIAFHTIAPQLWRKGNNFRDEKYAGVPSAIRSKYDVNVVYACTFSSDGGHQQMGIKEFIRYCQLFRRGELNAEADVHLMDRETAWTDIAKAMFLTFSLAWQFWLLDRRPTFRALWALDSVDIFPLIRRELRVALQRTPRYVLQMFRTRRYLRQTHPIALVTTLFEFCFGRATVFGAKTAGADIIVIGAQHGPMAMRQLRYCSLPAEINGGADGPDNGMITMPMPDAYLLEGRHAKKCMTSSGHPEKQMHVVGAPRLTLPMIKTDNQPKSCTTTNATPPVLFALAQHDDTGIVNICREVARLLPDIQFLVKPHPRSNLDLGGPLPTPDAEHSNWTVTNKSVSDLLSFPVVVLATYSSVGLEAQSLGHPVVLLQRPDQVSGSPLMDIKSNKVIPAYGPKKIADTIKELIRLAKKEASPTAKLDDSFFLCDSIKAEQLWAKTIACIAELHKTI